MSKIYIAKEVKSCHADKYEATTSHAGNYGHVNGSGEWQYRSFVQHDFSGIPSNSTIISAKLYVYAYEGNDNYEQGGHKFDVVTSEWSETTLTWNNQPTVANNPIPEDWLVPTNNAWNSWDITEFVDKWVKQTMPNYGLQFVNKDESSYRTDWRFYTRRYSSGEYASYVEVEYEEVEWSISQGRVEELANEVRRLTGETDKMTMEQMVTGLKSVIPSSGQDLNAGESAEHPGCYYRIVNGETEWLNPPMLLGVEYRTTERWNGDPVYTKAIDIGSLPNKEEKITHHSIENLKYPLSVSIFATKETWCFTVPSSSTNETTCLFNKKGIQINTSIDRSEYNGYATMRYTKNA